MPVQSTGFTCRLFKNKKKIWNFLWEHVTVLSTSLNYWHDFFLCSMTWWEMLVTVLNFIETLSVKFNFIRRRSLSKAILYSNFFHRPDCHTENTNKLCNSAIHKAICNIRLEYFILLHNMKQKFLFYHFSKTVVLIFW